MGNSPASVWLQTTHLALITCIQINACYFTNVKINLLFLCSKTSAFIASFGKTTELFGSFVLYSKTALTGAIILHLRALHEQGYVFPGIFPSIHLHEKILGGKRLQDVSGMHNSFAHKLLKCNMSTFFVFVQFLTQLSLYVSLWLNRLIYYA